MNLVIKWVMYFFHPSLKFKILLMALFLSLALFTQGAIGSVDNEATDICPTCGISNPLITQRADPWCIRHTDGNYYFTATVPEYDRIELRCAPTIDGLREVDPKVIWRKHDKGPMSYHIWAPEIHHIDDKWYVYFAAGRAEDIWAIRMYVLECAALNPMTGQWIEKGQLNTRWESFSLDATTFEHDGTRYLVWAQKDPKIRGNTNLYIAQMDSPWSITGRQVMITKPEYDWERIGFWVNEGPAVLIRNGRIFISYSASATDHNYCTGLLSADETANLLDPNSWYKSPVPVFKSSTNHSQYGPGHNSFTVASDGKTDLIFYHARNYKEIQGDPLRNPDRHTRVQKLDWKQDGTPAFGEPVPDGAYPCDHLTHSTAKKQWRLTIIGDSTVCEYPPEHACRGWGQYIQDYFKDTLRVINLAKSGRSTKTFINEGLWSKALKTRPDILLIQFGHNDSHAPDRPESTDAATDFQDYLRRYIDESRAINATPILVTPVQRRTYRPSGTLNNSLIVYANAMKKIAARKKVSVVDLNASSGQLYEQLGVVANDIVANAPEDRTHFNEEGARMIAHLVMQELTQLEPRLTKELDPEGPMARGKIAGKPLFRDPIYDGAADPVLCWNTAEEKWFMFYTNRRANAPNTPGVTWVHGTQIGIAESSDGGASWTYRGRAQINYGQGEYSYWAPEVIEHDGTYHMYLTFVPGIFADWSHPRDIIHLTSENLLNWKYESTLKLSSNRVIDACVIRLPDGTWRMWYNNEIDRKSIYYADSPDLYKWRDCGKAMGERPGEGPKVFLWKNRYWMVVDVWQGLGIYTSEDCLKWTRQPENLLEEPGNGPDDKVKGGHPDVVVSGDRAFLFYFTHPGRQDHIPKDDPYQQRRSSIQVVELKYQNGRLTCDRDKPTYIRLLPIFPFI